MAKNAFLGNAQPGKCTPWKMHNLENDRTENANPGKWQKKSHPGKWQKIHSWKMHTLENDRMENAHPGKWQKNHTLEDGRKNTPGKCTTWKMAENT